MKPIPRPTLLACAAAAAALTAGALAQHVVAQDGGPRAANSARTPKRLTFTEHVAPVIFNNCTSCHREGEVAPFALTNYAEVKKRGRMIAEVTKSRFMPPWHPVDGHGEFANSMRMKQADIDTIQRWVRQGMRRGDPKRLPPMPKFTKGWQLGKPDLVVKMERSYRVPADGPDIYRNFVVLLNLKEDKWVTAIEVRPSAPAVLHHTLFRTTRGRSAGRGDFGFRRGTRGGLGTSTSGLGGWAVGGQPRHLPMGLAVKIPKGMNLVLSSHFHPSGKVEHEQTTLGLHFTDKPPTRTMVGLMLPPYYGAAAGLNIKAGQKDFKIEDSFTLPVDVLGLTIGGHAHYVCKEMQIWATRPGRQKESIFWIDDWAFNWQNRYQYGQPLELPKGTKIEVRLTYDNSEDNPNNPNDPPRRVRWGLQSTDEMGSITLLMVAKRESETRELKDAMGQHARDHFRSSRAFRGIRGIGPDRWNFVIERYDKNKNGKLEKGELPYRYWRTVRRFDKNKDGTLDEKELEELKKSDGGLFGGGRRRR